MAHSGATEAVGVIWIQKGVVSVSAGYQYCIALIEVHRQFFEKRLNYHGQVEFHQPTPMIDRPGK